MEVGVECMDDFGYGVVVEFEVRMGVVKMDFLSGYGGRGCKVEIGRLNVEGVN